MANVKTRKPRAAKAEKLLEVVDVVETTETDEEILARLEKRFNVLDTMTQGAIDGHVRGMVVTGPPGIGKSFGVETILEKNSLFDKLAGNRLRFGVEKGAASAIGLYKLLYNYADANSVLVLDDCDSVLYDETSLNLLKAALDSGKKRKISWNTDSALLRREGIPDSFEFKGSVIFITNLKFDGVRGKLADHLAAILSRCHYLDLTINSDREKLLRVQQIVRKGMLEDYGFCEVKKAEVINFMLDNKHRLREISLRMVTKIADLRAIHDTTWMDIADVTCCKGS